MRVTFLPSAQLLRWAYAGHPPALWLDDGQELKPLSQGIPLGLGAELGCVEGSRRSPGGAGVLLYTDGLVEGRTENRTRPYGVERLLPVIAAQGPALPDGGLGEICRLGPSGVARMQL